MARKPRIHAPGAIYHVILRGNARQDIFLDDKDRYRFYSILENSCDRFHSRIHAFCLMTNHIHLEIQVGEVPLSRVMLNVGLRYTKWFNWRHNKTGHVFEGRYKAVMVDGDEYLLELAAYINLNPVRAGITTVPEKYRWSSYRAFLGKESLSWLETDFILSQFSQDLKCARRSFANFVISHVSEPRRKEFHGEKNIDYRIFGDDLFVTSVLGAADAKPVEKPNICAVIAAIKNIYGIDDNQLAGTRRDAFTSEARALAAWATLELSNGKLIDLAKYLKRAPSTMTSGVRRIERLSQEQEDSRILENMTRVRNALGYQVIES